MKWFIRGGAAASAVGAVLQLSAMANAQTVELKASVFAPATNPLTLSMEAWGNHLKEKSNGKQILKVGEAGAACTAAKHLAPMCRAAARTDNGDFQILDADRNREGTAGGEGLLDALELAARGIGASELAAARGQELAIATFGQGERLVLSALEGGAVVGEERGTDRRSRGPSTLRSPADR